MEPLKPNVEIGETLNNLACKLDLDFMEMSVPLKEIKPDGYEIGVNHRPIIRSKVNEMKRGFTGLNKKPVVVYSCDDGCYHVVEHQNFVQAVNELIKEREIEPTEEILCDIITRKSICNVLDAKNPDDRFLSFQYAYSIDDFEGKNCTADAIFMILYLSDAHKNKTDRNEGNIDYIYEHQFGYKNYSKNYIQKLMIYGLKLRELNLMQNAQEEQWTEFELDQELDDYQLGSNVKELNMLFPTWAYKRLEKKECLMQISYSH